MNKTLLGLTISVLSVGGMGAFSLSAPRYVAHKTNEYVLVTFRKSHYNYPLPVKRNTSIRAALSQLGITSVKAIYEIKPLRERIKRDWQTLIVNHSVFEVQLK